MSRDEQILSELGSIKTDIAVIKDRLNGEDGFAGRLREVEKDVRNLHGFKWWLAGIAAAVGVGFNFVLDLFKQKGGQ